MDWQIDARSQLTVGGVAPSRHTGDCRVPGGCDVTCVVMGKRRCANWRRQTPRRRLSHLASIWQSASRHLPGDEAYSPPAQLWAPLHFAKCEKGSCRSLPHLALARRPLGSDRRRRWSTAEHADDKRPICRIVTPDQCPADQRRVRAVNEALRSGRISGVAHCALSFASTELMRDLIRDPCEPHRGPSSQA